MLILLAAVALLLAAYSVGRWLEAGSGQPETRGDVLQRCAGEPSLEIDGATYRLRSSVTAILLMGVDRDSDAAVTGYRRGGQADFLLLVAIDEAQRKVMWLPIDRDTMAQVTVLGVLGEISGVRSAQIGLAHSFGDGGAQSCDLTVEAASKLLLGAPIDRYLAMNLDGIAVLNDAVGGVSVTLEDDFTALDPAMVQGRTLTLKGMQAEHYVRGRVGVGAGTNAARMARQRQYVSRLSQQLGERIREDQAYIGGLWDVLEPYLTTDMPRGQLSRLSWAARDYEQVELALSGEHRIGADGFMEFRIDEAALRQTVLELFCQKAE